MMHKISDRKLRALPLLLFLGLTCASIWAQTNPPGRASHLQFQPAPQAKTEATENTVTKEASQSQTENSKCTVSDGNYTFHKLWPLWRAGCHSDDQIEYFFNESSWISLGEAAKYLYNAQQSTSTVSADLLTTTFQPGLQVVFAGSATSGSGGQDNSSPSSATTSTSPSTDSVATAVSKLESGGDFNLRFPLPLLWVSKGPVAVSGQFTPNLGFTVNGLSAQTTITDTTQYSFNLPLEFYAQLASTKHATTPAVVFLDIKPAGEIISHTLATKLGPSVPTVSFLGEASIGIEFSQKLRVSGQYIYGNASIYKSGSSGTTTTTTSTITPTQKIDGFHLTVSFSK